MIKDSTGTVIWQGDYYAFGEIKSTQSSPGFANTHKFTGKEFDNPANYYYYNARYYDPAIGRFFSSDPIPTGNPYAYGFNNPLKFTDPTGMWGGIRLEPMLPEGPIGFARGQFSGAMPTSYYRMLYYTGQVYSWIDVRDPNYWTARLISEELRLSLNPFEFLAFRADLEGWTFSNFNPFSSIWNFVNNDIGLVLTIGAEYKETREGLKGYVGGLGGIIPKIVRKEAMTVGNRAFFVSEDAIIREWIWKHELVHYHKQYKILGPTFLPIYFIGGGWYWMERDFLWWDSPQDK